MASVPCPSCGKPCLPGAPVCRWCKTRIPAAVHAAAEVRRSPEVEAELREMKEWTGNDRKIPPAVSPRTWIAMAIAVVGITLAATISEKNIEVRVPATFIGGISSLVFLVFGSQDLRALRHRNRQTPDRAALSFFLRMKTKQWTLAGAALADYPSARARNEGVAREWKQALGASLEVTDVAVTPVEMLGEDAAVATVHVSLRSASAVGCLFFGILGAVLFAKRDVRVFEKLVLLRNGRWYLVNGLPEDRTDRWLIRDFRGDYPPAKEG